MENNYFTTYKFENYDVEGLKLEINFANAKFLEIKTHEEIDTPIAVSYTHLTLPTSG